MNKTLFNWRFLLPLPIRNLLRKLYFLPCDIKDFIHGVKDPMIPPKGKIFTGMGDYEKTGKEALDQLVNHCKLQPNHYILDVGCGIGRVAVPLTKYLSKEGKYEGFDIVKEGITWCQNKISSRYPNFHFQLSNVYNKKYNPKGCYKASLFKFPFAKDTFDVVYLGSVFTHMLPADVENYLKEIHRVLKPGGRCLITYFLITPDYLKLDDDQKKQHDIHFCYQHHGTYVNNLREPEFAVGYRENSLVQLYQETSLSLVKPIIHGTWWRDTKNSNYQDLIVAEKTIQKT